MHDIGVFLYVFICFFILPHLMETLLVWSFQAENEKLRKKLEKLEAAIVPCCHALIIPDPTFPQKLYTGALKLILWLILVSSLIDTDAV